MAKIDINKILQKPVSGFKSEIKEYSLSDLENLLYALKTAIDSPDNDEKTESKIGTFITESEKQIKKLSDIKKKNGVSAEEASANLASILGYGAPLTAPKSTGVKHSMDKPKKSIKDVAKKVKTESPKQQIQPVVSSPIEPVVEQQPKQKPKKKPSVKTGKSGQFLLFGFEPEQGNINTDSIQNTETVSHENQLSFDFNKKVKKEKTKPTSQSLLLRERSIALKEAQLEETKRRHSAVEDLEKKHLDVRNKESLRINQREKETNRVRLEAANLEVEKAKIKAEASHDIQTTKLKTMKSIQTSRARTILKKEQLKAEVTEKKLETAKEIKIAQLKYKKDRDEQKRKDAEARRLERENQRKNRTSKAKKDKVYGFLHEMSPTVGYAYKLASGGNFFGKSGGKREDSLKQSSSLLGHASDMLMSSGIGGAIGAAVSKSLGKAISFGKDALKSGGKYLLKGATSFPGIAGIISAVNEYMGGASLGKSLTVGAGATAGVAVGALAGSVLGPAGTIIGGILGGILGEAGARKIFDYFFGDNKPTQEKQLPSNIGGTRDLSQPTQQSQSGKIRRRSDSTKEQEYMDYFVSKGYTKEQAAGIVGNLVQESSLNPSAIGDNGQAYGIAQWNRKGSPDRYKNFQAQYGKDLSQASEKEQLDFIDWELRNSELNAGRALRNSRSAEEASSVFSNLYERPNQKYANNADRASNASRILSESTMKSSSERLNAATEKKDQTMKSNGAQPQQVVLANGGTNIGGNTTNTTVINAPETDPLIRQVSMFNMRPMFAL